MRCRWAPSRWLKADLGAGSFIACAAAAAIGLTPIGAAQPEPPAQRDTLSRLLATLGLEGPARAAPPRGLSIVERSPAEGAADPGTLPDAAAPAAAATGWRWRSLEGADALPARIVLLIHGLDEPGDIFHTLTPRLIEAGHRPVYFEYPNDQGATLSADELAEALRTLCDRGVERIDIVAHSMGGLIARDVLTREDLYAGAAPPQQPEGLPRVERLIMLGTPNQGSPWARLRVLSELREQVMRFADAPRSDRLLAFLDDGLGEAGRDLLPGSEYLTELNSRPLPQIPMTVVVGRVAPAAPGAAGGAADEVARVAAEGLRRLLGPGRRADDAADAASAAAAEFRRALELVEQSVGDGVVPAESALLEGVDDVVYVEANHRGMIRTIRIEQAARGAVGLAQDAEPPAVPVVLERLGRPDESR